jgi:hypothetical protein
LAVPSALTFSYRHTTKLHTLPSTPHPTIGSSHPLSQLQHLLFVYELILIPSDKTNVLNILPQMTIVKEMEIHLKDKDTYEQLTEADYYNIQTEHLELVKCAASEFSKPTLVPKSWKDRNIYFLPKTHKDIKDWRHKYHPKMRPIVSNAASITYNLARYLLEPLQCVERLFKTTCLSSLCVAYDINKLNTRKEISGGTLLATLDVESLFTKIPQQNLLSVLKNVMPNVLQDEAVYERYMHYLSSIIERHTFKASGCYYLQKFGLPMGANLSGTLANIYLGVLEENLSNKPGVLLYKRYMDDILIITNYDEIEFTNFLEEVKSNFRLNITSSFNRHCVTFLDMSIMKSPHEKRFHINPYSKNSLAFPPIYPPFTRDIYTDFAIIKAQILRVWRLSTHSRYFSSTVNNYLNHLSYHRYQLRIRRMIFKFLLPVRISTHFWSTSIPLC